MSDTENDSRPATTSAADAPLTERGVREMIREELRAALLPLTTAIPTTIPATVHATVPQLWVSRCSCVLPYCIGARVGALWSQGGRPLAKRSLLGPGSAVPPSPSQAALPSLFPPPPPPAQPLAVAGLHVAQPSGH